MSLTGLPLLVVVALLAIGCAAGTVVMWSRLRRWRVVVRTVGILMTEATVVLAVGLQVNRSEQFYPTWAALAGDTGTESAVAPARAGDLDATLARRSTLPWQPPELPSWQLAKAPTVTVPPDYLAQGSARYPVLITLGGTDAGAAPVAGVVTLTLAPTRSTTAQNLRTLADALRKDIRVTEGGWAMVAGADKAALAGEFTRAQPARFRALAVVEHSKDATLTSVGTVPSGTALAAVRPETPPGPSGTLPPGVADLTAAAPNAWQTAVTWVAAKLSSPLSPPLLLPTASTP
ncbi:hypothetical protein QLQ12_26055 [Actinoplanes sp. NEAU-A12]|uniref:Uncharacterized protein n=1 Tax=Actinoplanes sandaracinus TaxID=3045177 RepID=A0ABT6WQS1_9ACTN|nr:hypothetical protein [Actinoplanes sandaracinus]MDI6102087.1 hypothetical protein [Actinoplanes sandaracinus]